MQAQTSLKNQYFRKDFFKPALSTGSGKDLSHICAVRYTSKMPNLTEFFKNPRHSWGHVWQDHDVRKQMIILVFLCFLHFCRLFLLQKKKKALWQRGFCFESHLLVSHASISRHPCHWHLKIGASLNVMSQHLHAWHINNCLFPTNNESG